MIASARLGLPTCRDVSSVPVLRWRHGLKMLGFDATAITTKVIDLEAFGDGAHEQAIRRSVGGSPCVGVPAEHAVPSRRMPALPQPTAIALNGLALEPLPLCHGYSVTQKG